MTGLHLGCGSVRLDGWINVDLDSPTADMRLDLREPLPFGDASLGLVYAEHFIEHIDRPSAVALLRECRRVLVPGGTLRLSTPSLEHLAACYLRRDIASWGDLWQPGSPCRLLNEGMRAWGHVFVYDSEELEAVLREAGFEHVAFVRWRDSDTPALRGLESRPDHDDLIVEARVHGIEAPDRADPHRSMLREAQRGAGGYLGMLEGQLAARSATIDAAIERERALRAQFERAAQEIDALRADRDRLAALEADHARFRASPLGIVFRAWRRLAAPGTGAPPR